VPGALGSDIYGLATSGDVHADDGIVTQSEEWEVDLIVMGTHGRRGFRRLASGLVLGA